MNSIIVGSEIGRWTVIGGPIRQKRLAAASVNYIDVYQCRCACGTVRMVRKHKLLRNSRSCGCLKREQFIEGATRHGETGSRLYVVWDGMMQRCGNPNSTNYVMYGGRGIWVCQAWRKASAFLAWAKPGYRPGLQIERIDNNKGYSPSNCRWVTDAENKRNTRNTRLITAFGETKCATDWGLDPRCHVRPQSIVYRITRLSWSPEDAVARPRRTRKRAASFDGNHVRVKVTDERFPSVST